MIRGNRPRLDHWELSVLTRLLQGLKPKQISGELCFSQDRYTKIRNRILTKLGAMNDAQIGVLAERYQLVSVDERNRIEDRREALCGASN
jgi:DNA-binding NarL/FixJ family response regulator